MNKNDEVTEFINIASTDCDCQVEFVHHGVFSGFPFLVRKSSNQIFVVFKNSDFESSDSSAKQKNLYVMIEKYIK